MICAGRVINQEVCIGRENTYIGACQGDSGGPLMYNQDGVFELHGVTSFGNSCGIFPGVYANMLGNQ